MPNDLLLTAPLFNASLGVDEKQKAPANLVLRLVGA
jgi:hypothetical protein